MSHHRITAVFDINRKDIVLIFYEYFWSDELINSVFINSPEPQAHEVCLYP